jgi:hypothetical protein
LRDDVNGRFVPGNTFGNGKGQRHCRVDMATGNVTNGIHHSCDGDGKGKTDHAKIGHRQRSLPAIDQENRRGNRAGADQNQEASSQHLGKKLLRKCRGPIHSVLVYSSK